MANPACTGNGSQLTLSGGWTGRLLQIDPFVERLAEFDDTAIDDTGYQRFCTGVIKEHDQVTFQYFFDPDVPLTLTSAAVGETITIDFPLPIAGGNTTAANLAGTGWIVEAGSPTLSNNERMIGTGTIRFKGSDLVWLPSAL